MALVLSDQKHAPTLCERMLFCEKDNSGMSGVGWDNCRLVHSLTTASCHMGVGCVGVWVWGGCMGICVGVSGCVGCEGVCMVWVECVCVWVWVWVVVWDVDVCVCGCECGCECEWLCGVWSVCVCVCVGGCVCGLSHLAYISEFSTTHVPLCMNNQQTISTHLKTSVDNWMHQHISANISSAWGTGEMCMRTYLLWNVPFCALTLRNT